MPRKKAESVSAINKWVDEVYGSPQHQDIMKDVPKPAIIQDTDENMVARYLSLKTWIEGEKKRFETHLAPHKDEMDNIEAEFLKRFNERGQDASPTEHGTAYKSTLLNVSISPEGPVYKAEHHPEPLTGRDAFLEACLDHWGDWGGDMLVLGKPQIDSVNKYMEDHEGQPPPGVKTSKFTRVNIRRS